MVPTARPETIVIGLGNPILGDDGVGWQLTRQVEARLAEKRAASSRLFEFDYLSAGGLGLMERLVGYTRALLINSITTGLQPVGTVNFFTLDDLPLTAGHLTSAHDASLQDAVSMGRALGAPLPAEILILAIEILPCFDFSEELSPTVLAAIPDATIQALNILEQLSPG